MPPRVYISGPLTCGDRAWNRTVAKDVARDLLRAGYAVFCPHLFSALGLDDEIPYETWLCYDFQWLHISDAVWRIPGESPGADRECARAGELGIPVVSSLAELEEVFQWSSPSLPCSPSAPLGP
jgi:hypothetical protein